MAFTFTDSFLKSIGYTNLSEWGSVSANFRKISAYQIQGIHLPEDAVLSASNTINNVNFQTAASNSINKACFALTNENFVESEEDWAKKNNCTGPYLLILLGPTDSYETSIGHIKLESDGSLTTHSAFPQLEADLKLLESEIIPKILTSFSCKFNSDLIKRGEAVVGQTIDRRTIRDIQFNGNMRAYTSQRITEDEFSLNFSAAQNLASSLNPKSAKHFTLGLEEKDGLKKFLYFFLAIEVETHASFGKINHQDALSSLLIPEIISSNPEITTMLKRHTNKFSNLLDKFIWCSATIWPHISTAEISSFIELKKTRDSIAHGAISMPPAGHPDFAKKLAQKILMN